MIMKHETPTNYDIPNNFWDIAYKYLDSSNYQDYDDNNLNIKDEISYFHYIPVDETTIESIINNPSNNWSNPNLIPKLLVLKKLYDDFSIRFSNTQYIENQNSYDVFDAVLYSKGIKDIKTLVLHILGFKKQTLEDIQNEYYATN